MQPERRGPEQSRPDPHEVMVFVAAFPSNEQARHAEQSIGRLAADGVIDVYDGELHEWPADSLTPRRRTLENIPRLAALPATVWASGSGLPQIRCATGWSAIMIFGITNDSENVRAELIGAGGATTTTAMTADQYAQLRRAA